MKTNVLDLYHLPAAAKKAIAKTTYITELTYSVYDMTEIDGSNCAIFNEG
ncbi:MAG: hypothetical protein LBH00_00085 [Planctomycetaceae bacterium]|nr:hypothetical protein [Planctomycetaceae bacterium]